MLDSFDIIHHDRKYNTLAEKLVVLGSRFENYTSSPYYEYNIEVLTTPSVLDDVIHWKVFKDDAQVQIFL